MSAGIQSALMRENKIPDASIDRRCEEKLLWFYIVPGIFEQFLLEMKKNNTAGNSQTSKLDESQTISGRLKSIVNQNFETILCAIQLQ